MKTETMTGLSDETKAFYLETFKVMKRAGIPFLVGGAYAFEQHVGISRHTKDVDIFIAKKDCDFALKAFQNEGYRTELTDANWLAKVFNGDDFGDLIFGSGNGLCPVDKEWFEYAKDGQVFGEPVKLCPPEEMIWQKAFIQERHRYDGADVLHLLMKKGEEMDWKRLRRRFGDHWHPLLSHLILFSYVYPSHRSVIPAGLLDELVLRMKAESLAKTEEDICMGPFLSRYSFETDVTKWGLRTPEGMKKRVA